MLKTVSSIAIDPGHGGFDSGAVSPGGRYREKDVNLLLAAELSACLELSDCLKPLLLRSEDRYMSLAQRVKAAEREKADLYLSLHHNGFADPAARGSETFYYPGSEGEKAARLIQNMIVSWLGIPDRGIKEGRDLYVLKNTTMAAVLVEPLFLTSPADIEYLEGQDYYTGLAELLEYALVCWAEPTI